MGNQRSFWKKVGGAGALTVGITLGLNLGLNSAVAAALPADSTGLFERLAEPLALDPSLTLNEWLTHLPESLRRNVVYLYHSESPQKASAGSPRVVVFSSDARLILAWNGGALPGRAETDPDHTVDALELDPRTLRYEPRALHFTHAGRQRAVVDRAPKTCTQCHNVFHGVEPAWATYRGPVRPGVFGNNGQPLFAQLEDQLWRRAAGERAQNPRFSPLIVGGEPRAAEREHAVRLLSRLLKLRDDERRKHFLETRITERHAGRVSWQWKLDALSALFNRAQSNQWTVLRARNERAITLLQEATAHPLPTIEFGPVGRHALSYRRELRRWKADLWSLAWNAETVMEQNEFERRMYWPLDFISSASRD